MGSCLRLDLAVFRPRPDCTGSALTYNATTGNGLSQFCASGTSCLTSAKQTNSTIAGGRAGEALVKYPGRRSQL
jgi:hypothetical protein